MSTKRASSGACPDSVAGRPSRKRLRASDEAEASPLLLPLDLLLEIAVRADVATVVRCAAILEQDFRRRRSAAGFDPSSLRAISYKLVDREGDILGRPHISRLFQTPPPSSPSDPISCSRAISPCLEPVAWRDGLVILRHRQRGELTACNPITGHNSPLHDSAALVVSDDYPHALLTVDDAGGANFELLVADKDLRFQTYSSRDGKWSAVARAAAAAQQHHLHVHHPPSQQIARYRGLSRQPVVINNGRGRNTNTVLHWLCGCRGMEDADRLHIVALDVDTAGASARAAVIDLPRGCVSRMMATKSGGAITLAVSADGRRLSLVVSETQVISLWTASESEGCPDDQITWSRRVVVDRQEYWGVHKSIRFEGFGELSGTVLFYVGSVGLVQLSLATNRALVVLHKGRYAEVSQVCLHEINLPSLLQAMKPFQVC